MKFPGIAAYERLYKRFIDNGTQAEEFIALAKAYRRDGNLMNLPVLDLCAGGGQITHALDAAGARPIVMVDSEEGMIAQDLRFRRPSHIELVLKHVRPALEDMKQHGARFEAAFCRQGVNYWLDPDCVFKLARVMNCGAPFVFNTFAERPPEPPDPPLVKQYTIRDEHYVEVSWYKYGVVTHVQCLAGMEPHVTTFSALSTANLRDLFAQFFELEIKERGKSLLCIARRNSTCT